MVDNEHAKKYCDDETKKKLIELFKKRSHVARSYAYILIIGIVILFMLFLILTICKGFFLTSTTDLPSQSDYVNLGVRLAVITVLLVFAKILLTTYQNFMSMARFYDARADALEMLGNDFNVRDYEIIINLLTLPPYIWGRKVDIQTNIIPYIKKDSTK